MKRYLFYIFFALPLLVVSQEKIIGTISYLNKTNVYLKFKTTDKISIGEVLYFGDTACLRVVNKSSSSVVCEPISDCKLTVGDQLDYHLKYEQQSAYRITPEEKPQLTENPIPTVLTKKKSPGHLVGRIAQSSYYTKDEFDRKRNRFRTLVSLHADQLENKRLSFDTYLTYQYQTNINEQTHTTRANIYNFSATYETENKMLFSLGRKINPKLSIVGAIDGLQIEKGFNDFYVGSFVGTRPDTATYGFNADLLQYGAYIGVGSNKDSASSQTSLGVVQQTFAGAIDRRFFYMQHQSTIASDLHLFGSMEYDIYSTTPGLNRLTNLYTSVRYRMGKGSSLMLSYDSRKRIIYYETYQNEVERLLDDDLARQGIRLRLNFRPAKYIYSGLSFSNRFKSDGSYDSKNYYAYSSFSKLPYIGGKLSLSGTINQSNYLNSIALSIKHSRVVLEELFAEVYFRKGIFDYTLSGTQLNNNYLGLSLNHQNAQLWQLGLSTEVTTNTDGNGLRTYFRIAKRFK